MVDVTSEPRRTSPRPPATVGPVADPAREEPIVFDAWCPRCEARVLLTTRRLLRLQATPSGHRAHLRCWCGAVASLEVRRDGTTVDPCAPPTGAAPSHPSSCEPEPPVTAA